MQIDRLTEIAAWREFAPRLHICDEALFGNATPIELPTVSSISTADLLKREGYVHAPSILSPSDIALLAETVRSLTASKLSPVFAFVFDEFWLPFFQLAPVYRSLLGDYRMLPDFWVWDVDPRRAEAGWKPHRDKGYIALLQDRMPKSLTTWIPLSQATPLNSCMYLVPAMLDPTYGTPQDSQWKFDLQSVRALPAMPGDFLMWNQAILHWGSRSSARGTETRVSMAFEFQRSDVAPFNEPLLDPTEIPSFDKRLKLISKQILQYKHMYGVTPPIEQLARRLTS